VVDQAPAQGNAGDVKAVEVNLVCRLKEILYRVTRHFELDWVQGRSTLGDLFQPGYELVGVVAVEFFGGVLVGGCRRRSIRSYPLPFRFHVHGRGGGTPQGRGLGRELLHRGNALPRGLRLVHCAALELGRQLVECFQPPAAQLLAELAQTPDAFPDRLRDLRARGNHLRCLLPHRARGPGRQSGTELRQCLLDGLACRFFGLIPFQHCLPQNQSAVECRIGFHQPIEIESSFYALVPRPQYIQQQFRSCTHAEPASVLSAS
jgi:hypothetical protein